MATHNNTGQKGEQIASLFLQQKGYEIIDENWVYGKAEIDLIALYNHQIIFIEVKTRTGIAFGQPEDFVTPAKQKMMEQAANEYVHIMSHDGEIRFDVVGILMNKDGGYTIKHIEDAFWPID